MRFLLLRRLRSGWPTLLAMSAFVAAATALLVVERHAAASLEERVHGLTHTLGRNMLVVGEDTDLEAFHTRDFGSGEGLPADAPSLIRQSQAGAHVQLTQARVHGSFETPGGPVLVVGEATWKGAGPPAGAEPYEALLAPVAALRLDAARGDEIELNGSRLRVADILSPPPDGLDTAVFVSPDTARSITGRSAGWDSLRLGGCWCSVDVSELGRQVEAAVPGSRALTVKGVAEAQQQTLNTVVRYGRVLEVVLLVLVAAVLFALVAVRVRREAGAIALLLAIGATPGRLTSVYLLESVAVALAGLAAGWALAFPVASTLAPLLLGQAVTLPTAPAWPLFGLILAVSTFTAGLAARALGQIDPTQALREV